MRISKKSSNFAAQNNMLMKVRNILMVLCAVVMVSCQDNTPECKYHRVTRSLSTKTDSQKHWQFDSVARQFYCHFDIPELTSYAYTYGEWSLSQIEKLDDGRTYQVLLPRSDFNTDIITEPTVVYYTQHIDYRVGIGYADIQVTNSDYLYSPEKPETMYFRLQAGDSIRDLTVVHEDWNFDEQTRQYYYHFNLQDVLTAEVYDYGFWTLHREYNKGTANAYQVALPLSSFLTDTLTEDAEVYYQSYLDYRVGIGCIEVQLTNSDHLYFQDTLGHYILPNEMNFRLQLTY